MDPELEFRRQVKDALEHLYDTACLETHSLLEQFRNQAADSRLTRAQKLRTLLKEAIESLRPQGEASTGSPGWRSYLALRNRYVQGLSQGETEIELGISLRQLQRELHKGLDAVASLLWQKRTNAIGLLVPNTIQEVQDELNQWEISRQNCEVQTLVDDTLWMLRPLLNERGITLQVDLSSNLSPVFVDATLTRQALFMIARLWVRKNTLHSLSIQAQEEESQTSLILHNQEQVTFDSEEDWQIAQLICQQQGSQLKLEALPGASAIIFALPRASQPRVLVIDDNAAIHQLFERYLAPHNYAIIHARGGQEALQLAVEKIPSAITLDVMMPNVDGWQVLRTLAENPATAQIPVVICSVLKEPELAFSLGARAYLKKPVDRLELVSTLARLLSSADPAAAAPLSTLEDS